MMTPVEFKKACRLYKAFKVETAEYESLASKYGMSICDLNVKCHHHFRLLRLAKCSGK